MRAHHYVIRKEVTDLTKLDYSLRDYDSRKKCVEDALEKSKSPSSQYLEYMADYLLFTGDSGTTKQERDAEYPLITKNREVTVAKRQVSYEEIADSSDYGDDVINAIALNDKNRIMDSRKRITDSDLRDVPGLRENQEVIESLKRQMEEAEGSRKFALKKQIISNYQEQYVLRESHFGGTGPKASLPMSVNGMRVPDENVWVDEDGFPHADGSASLLNPEFVSILLRNYSDLKSVAVMDLESDIALLLMDLDRLVEKTLLPDHPVLWDILTWKICKHTNEDIAIMVYQKYRSKHSEQYYSTIWNHRIPQLIAKQAQKEWVLRHHAEIGFTEWKICSKCGVRKLKHPMFFSPNSSSSDGYYTICKQCRTKDGEQRCR